MLRTKNLSNLFISLYFNVSLLRTKDFIEAMYILSSYSTAEKRGYSRSICLTVSRVYLSKNNTWPSYPTVMMLSFDTMIWLILYLWSFLVLISSKLSFIKLIYPFFIPIKNPRVLSFWKGTIVVSLLNAKGIFFYNSRFGSFQRWRDPSKYDDIN